MRTNEPQVDVETSKRALRLAQEAVQLGTQSLQDLSLQGGMSSLSSSHYHIILTSCKN
jgi:hypothetical protein